MEYAGVGRRCGAVLVDMAIFTLLALLTGGGYSIRENGTYYAGVEVGGWWLLAFFGYYIVFEAVTGWTIGKLVVGIQVVAENGDSISWGQALGRNLLRPVDGFFFYFVAAVFVWSSSKRQRVGDRAANTFVIRDHGGGRGRESVRPIAFEPLPAAAADEATYTHEQFLEDLARVKRDK